MRPTFAQLEAFYWAGRLGGFHAAARHLHLTQPTISARVAELEFTLGEKLFNRIKQKVELTIRGREILGSVENILNISDQITTKQNDHEVLRGLLRLGAVESVAFFVLPILLPKLRESFPDLKIELTLDIGTILNKKMIANELDIAILTDARVGDDVTVERAGDLVFAWIASPDFPLPDRVIKPADLREVPILAHPERSTIHRVMMEWFHGGNVEPEHVTFCNSLSLNSRMIGAGYGVSILQPHTLLNEISSGNLRVIETDPPVDDRPLAVAYYSKSASFKKLVLLIQSCIAESGLISI